MIKLRDIVNQLDEDNYKEFSESLVSNKADKFLTLLESYREEKSEDAIIDKLGVNKNAYYTLKSRLYDKLQDHLIENIDGPKIELLRKVAAIPNIIYKSNREAAVATLTKLEKDLIYYDMAYELITVYHALKMLHTNSPKYYDYTAQYNKHVAYTLALDKLEDLLAEFNKKLGNFMLSRDTAEIEIISLIKKEVANVCAMYDSHRMFVFQAVVNVLYSLYIPESKIKNENLNDDEPVEDILSRLSEVLTHYSIDTTYQLFDLVYNYLSFEYYHKLGVEKKETTYYDVINENTTQLFLYNFTIIPGKFLLSKVAKHVKNGTEAALYEEAESLNKSLNPDPADAPNFVLFYYFRAYAAYYSQKYDDAIDILNDLLNQISFRNMAHMEMDVKLFLAYNYCLITEYNLAGNLVRSIGRKSKEFTDRDYDNITTFIQILQLPMKAKPKDAEESVKKLANKFKLLNQTDYPVLQCLEINDEAIAAYCRPIV